MYKLIKLIAVSLTISWLMPTQPLNAADRPALIESQNKEYAKTLFVDSVMKDKDFSALYDRYKMQDPLSEPDPSLESNMKSHYQKYCVACAQQTIMPFVPSGPLSFLAAGLDIFGARKMGVHEEMDEISLRCNLVGPSPAVKFSELFKMVNSILIPKYREACTLQMKKVELNLEGAEKREVLKFLLTYTEEELVSILSDPDLLIIAGRLLAAQPVFSPGMFMSGHDMPGHNRALMALRSVSTVLGLPLPYYPHGPYGVFPYADYKPVCLLANFTTVNSGKIEIKFQKRYELLKSVLDSSNMHPPLNPQEQEMFQKVRDGVLGELDKVFNIGGRQVYSIERDAKVLDDRLTKWFHMMHQLSYFEKRAWKKNALLLEQFERQATYAMNQLSTEDDKMYSGVSEGPYTVSLIRTTKKDQAENKADLVPLVNERMEAHRAEVDRHFLVKPFANVLKQTVNWFEEIGQYIKKDGRMS